MMKVHLKRLKFFSVHCNGSVHSDEARSLLNEQYHPNIGKFKIIFEIRVVRYLS